MNPLKSLSWLVVAAVMTVATAVSAAPQRGFAGADVNKDRALSKAEACAGKTPTICKRFERMDVNKDGVVTRAEAKAFRNAKRVARGVPPKP